MLPKSIAIVGGGEAAPVLAALVSLASVQVTLIDTREDFLREAMRRVNQELERLLAAEFIHTEKKVDALDRILTATTESAAAKADIVFELLPDNEQKKLAAWQQLDRVCSPNAIFCTDAVFTPLSGLAVAVSNQPRFAGVHFSRPIHASRLVEVVRTAKTSDQAIDTLKEFLWSLGKVPLVLNERPGLLSERLFLVNLCEACRLLEEGVAEAQGIDLAFRLSRGNVKGPFESADLAGLDYCLEAIETLYKQLGDEALRPPKILAEKVRANALGVKTGKGFFEYKG